MIFNELFASPDGCLTRSVTVQTDDFPFKKSNFGAL